MHWAHHRSINFFCIVGALNAGLICDKFGRRLTFTFSCLVFIVGLLIQVVATGCVDNGSERVGWPTQLWFALKAIDSSGENVLNSILFPFFLSILFPAGALTASPSP